MLTCITRSTKKKGISTILGMIMFVAVITSAYVPMLLNMRQADTLYDQKLHEWETFDDEKDRETVMKFYSYPDADDDELIIEIENNSPLTIYPQRVWVNDTYYNVSTSIPPMSTVNVMKVPIQVDLGANSSFTVMLTTNRGNTYEATGGSVEWDGSEWYVQQLAFMVQISGSGFLGFGSYRVKVTNVTDTLVAYDMTLETSFSSGDATLFFDVTEAGAGKYKFELWKRSWFSWSYQGFQKHEMKWPSGPAIEWVYFD
ncbi:hypothetical protein ACFL0D_00970 [Thermoproteota archaeon]